LEEAEAPVGSMTPEERREFLKTWSTARAIARVVWLTVAAFLFVTLMMGCWKAICWVWGW
jgi:hypothetical protein